MRSPRRRTPPRRAVVLLGLAAALVGLGGGVGTGVQAQEAPPNGDTLFGSYALESRGLGVQARYEIAGLLPGGSPVLDLTVPETLARFASGPTGYGLASLAYPGGLIVNLGSLVAQGGGGAEAAAAIPDYPIKAEAFFPSGPVEVHQNQGGATEDVRTTELGVNAAGAFPGVEADPVIHVASITSTSRSAIEEGKAVARTRVVLGGVRLLGGVITMDSLVTDLVAVHDGTNGTASGGTTATGVKFLGLAASLTGDGLVLDEAPPATGPAAPLGTLLGQVLDPLSGLTKPVQDLLRQVLDQAVPSLDTVLDAAGIHLELLGGGKVTSDSGASGYQSSGLSLTFSYAGKEQAGLATLINSIPPELRPSVGPLPNPISFLTENHIAGLTLGTGTVSALASSPFDIDDLAPDDTLPDVTFPDFQVPDIGGSDFSTPLPDLPAPDGNGGSVDLGDTTAAALSAALPAALLILLVLASPLLGLASTRLADNVLAPVASTSCPSGLDQPPTQPRQP